jgi:DNA/RNA-binding domain of Phe-tRNA-synthetase-like protein
MIQATDDFRIRYPGARLGILCMSGVSNPASHPGLDERKTALENELRVKFGGLDRPALKRLPVISVYDAYYRSFDKSYHVLLQLESVALKGKALPCTAALVEAMFMAELESQILTAGHDLEVVKEPLTLRVAEGTETYVGIRGREEGCTRGDMMIADSLGVISSVLHGPDSRTCITPLTTGVLFTAYAPEGVGGEALQAHLGLIESLVRVVAPAAVTTVKEIV